MFRCLLVDDEYYARQRVRRCVNWEELGFMVAGEAGSVQEALEKLAQETFHLAVVDITMPGESGLDFIAQAAEARPGLVVIVLSGYAEFEYAQQAMRYGVKNYLTKPVNQREMEQALQGAAQLLARRQKQETGVFWRHFFHTEPLAKGVEAEQALLCNGVDPQGNYRVLLGDVREVKNITYQRLKKLNIEIVQLLAGCLQQPVLAATQDSFGHALLVMQMPKGETSVRMPLEEALCSIETHSGVPYVLACASPCKGQAQALQNAYQQAELLFLSKLFHPVQSLLLQQRKNKKEGPNLEEQTRCVERSLQTSATSQLEKCVEEIFERLAQLGDVQTLEIEVIKLLNLLRTQAAVQNTNLFQMEDRLIWMVCREMIAGSDTLLHLKERLFFQMQVVVQEKEGSEQTNKRVQEASALIEELYHSYGFGLEELAARLMVSPAYISNQFKKYTGHTVTQHINRLRMERASQLLLQPAMSITQVAEAVGFADVFYFSKSFKKYYGMPPSAYRGQ